MKRAPSVKALVRDLRITPAEARTVRGLIKGTIDPYTVERTARWIDQGYGRPSAAECIMDAIDATIGTYGVEALGPELNDGRFTPRWTYCNAGDTYAATIVRDNARGTYALTTWGDIVERASRAPRT